MPAAGTLNLRYILMQNNINAVDWPIIAIWQSPNSNPNRTGFSKLNPRPNFGLVKHMHMYDKC